MNNSIHANRELCRYMINPHRPGNYRFRIFLAMKLTAILLTAFCFQVSATAYPQGITINEKNAPLEKVMRSIRQQSGYGFILDLKQLKNAKPVSVDFKAKSLMESLEIIFEHQPFIYEVKDKVIIISSKKIPDEKKQQELIKGKVVDENGKPLPGATIKVKGTDLVVTTNENGEFTINTGTNSTLSISFIGYITEEILVTAQTSNINVALIPETGKLDEVSIVSTGYQEISAERATGSFVKIDNELLNRRVSTNILDRINGIANGVIFNSNSAKSRQTGQPDISVRGRSTIFSNDQPLIVVDNFPFDGNINDINPADVADITILKDAAAASIWGARSGNGVIVITTKKGSLNQPLKIAANSNVTIGQTPDLFYNPNFLNSTDYIQIEQMLFSKGFYNADINSTQRPPISPVVEMLAAANADEAALNVLRGHDVRKDFEKYLYQNSNNQQYSFSLNGGNDKATYYLSSGFDSNRENLKRNDYQRITLSSSNSFRPTRNLEISVSVNFIQTNQANNNPGWGTNPLISAISPVNGLKNIYPYAQFADANNNPLAIVKDYRQSYLQTLGTVQLLDWQYRPIEELALADNNVKSTHARINTGIRYSFGAGLSADLRYQFEKALTINKIHNSQQTYFARDLINLHTMPGTGQSVTYRIPLGGILDQTLQDLSSNTGRIQLNYNKTIDQKHVISALAGYEVKEAINRFNTYRVYGYDDKLALAGKVDYISPVNRVYPYARNSQVLPNIDAIRELNDRFRSVLAIASYSYAERYLISASARRDESNLFGVNPNQKGVPLWSAGLGWVLSNEKFYTVPWLTKLKLRSSIGYTGNLDKSTTAYLTARYQQNFVTGAQSAVITNPANPNLRWERVRIINSGIDFAIGRNIVVGSLEFYTKKGLDLIGNEATAPASGLTNFRGNVAESKGHGIDFSLNTTNLNGKLLWQSNFLFSYAIDEVTKYNGAITSTTSTVNFSDGNTAQSIFPVKGRSVYALYSYPWAGLDPATGDPQGYWEGQVTKDYAKIMINSAFNDLVYNGPSRPPYFGSVRNTLSYANISVSANITYSLGYYFRRSSINYDRLFTSWTGHQDFANRWLIPGDEMHTDVPSMIYPNINSRDSFYNLSEVLVEDASHIRLQDIQISYLLDKKNWKTNPFYGITAYLYANNLGILWRANKYGLDPEASVYPNPKTLSLGFKIDF